MKKFATLTLPALLALMGAAKADETPLFVPQWLGAQYTFVDQHQDSLHSPYAGEQSLRARSDTARSHTFGAYFGVALPAHLQFYFDVEMFKGEGVSHATGLGGLTNGDVIRSGTASLGKTPYVARRYLRWALPLGDETADVERAQDQLPGKEASRRIEVKIGKMAVNDDFDKNRYADSTRTQFMNWALFNNTTWDFAADTRGYTEGVMIGWINPGWSLRYGIYRMPYEANGQKLESSLRHARGQQIELTLQPQADGWALRLLAFQNQARMGIYREAIAKALASGSPPDIRVDDRPGRHKYGFAINGELPLADHGDTGLFLRAGWNDGRNESFAFTEVDRTLTGGFQLSGVHWGRGEDHLSIGVAINELSSVHRDYLAMGGNGFVLGDGALRYGREQILEAYYSFAVCKHFILSPDLQLIHNPGYNRDRGPARFVALRAHVEL
ncbi:Carbohydrate-selective porin, OprB family [Dyella sp. OK004]|uniref:carbohydrate porin n=1 Tax=Dyella sp. OK004 TaxID=1855292 RepID=UPI0008E8815F|nr:carbohydrate porin [Dyella sp. OK004]SFS18526.1 Carbohydrate-selective porin, OprB family [Dyella sp. OK004]